MKAKEVLTKIKAEVAKGLAAIKKDDIKKRVEPRLVRHFVGVYFEEEVIDRLSKRYRGEVPDAATWTLKKELHQWGHKLITVLKAEKIDQTHFDRIVECAIASQNKGMSELRNAERVALKASKAQDIKGLIESVKDTDKYTKEPEPITLGDALGVE